MAPSSGFVPRRRASGLVTEELEGETLLYVEASHRAFCLNPPAARVWKSIDGARDVDSIARSAELEPALVATTLREMSDAGLLETPADALPAPEVNLSRRRMIRAGLVAIPIILAITVPRAAEAASCVTGLPGTPCDPTHHCCTGVCNENAGTCG
ncbi:MAG TPA: PqqD family protein [Myxococcaceae bacterium]|nr:PqqD family protein [Myxococcaceae bacterium]